MCTGAGLALAQLLDQRDALLQLRLACFELRDLREDRLRSACVSRSALGDVAVERARLLVERPEPPADAEDGDDQDQAAPSVTFCAVPA